jgi:plasmid stabilization system protein ParE
MRDDVVLLPEAQHDVDSAHRWYESQQAGLGDRFLKTLDERFAWIRKNPLMAEVVHGEYRRLLVRPFPFAIIYKIQDDLILINSVFHCSQDPQKLADRLR